MPRTNRQWGYPEYDADTATESAPVLIPVAAEPPYKVTKAPTTAPKRVHLLIPCLFVLGPLNGSTMRMRAGEDKLPPPTYKPGDAGGQIGLYRLVPGKHEYRWVKS